MKLVLEIDHTEEISHEYIVALITNLKGVRRVFVSGGDNRDWNGATMENVWAAARKLYPLQSLTWDVNCDVREIVAEIVQARKNNDFILFVKTIRTYMTKDLLPAKRIADVVLTGKTTP